MNSFADLVFHYFSDLNQIMQGEKYQTSFMDD